ncbi:hypothetical protein F5984_15135 [Rudanella paleaurantiibacter]|uniref:Uncharacterized protein n=1 Tax=Rudanella paleaurantiibacter TaxID=2614655 RepID=A0A7J5TZB2_9BACT|nr:hypothetical protein [Rudanella paleaurantiibacter]KAB7730474.1 hypothetical protein F5984_15135 [Rudanella paleaurantiibacter]
MNQPEIQPDVYALEKELVREVTDFLANDRASGPIELINSLVYTWVSSGAPDMTTNKSQSTLFDSHLLVNFLSRLQEYVHDIEVVQMRQEARKE